MTIDVWMRRCVQLFATIFPIPTRCFASIKNLDVTFQLNFRHFHLSRQEVLKVDCDKGSEAEDHIQASGWNGLTSIGTIAILLTLLVNIK